MNASFYYFILFFVFVLDQLTKYLATAVLSSGKVITVIPHILTLSYVENTGAAFGILPNQRIMLIIVGVIVGFAAFWLHDHLPLNHYFTQTGLAFLFGGNLGNLINRILSGKVVDFFTLPNFPSFNMADITINFGVALLIYAIIFEQKS